MNCNWSETPDANGLFPCLTCGFTVPRRTIRKNCGVTPVDRQPSWHLVSDAAPRAPGVGDRLQLILAGLSIKKKGCGRCDEMIGRMNAWGVAGCREHRAEIAEHLKTAYEELTWSEWLLAIARAATNGLVLRINPFDRIGSLVDEAIRQFESEATAGSASGS